MKEESLVSMEEIKLDFPKQENTHQETPKTSLPKQPIPAPKVTTIVPKAPAPPPPPAIKEPPKPQKLGGNND